jgi:hypothetical protein
VNKLLNTYWIEFGAPLNMHFGVTAYSFDDAMILLKQRAFVKQSIPAVKNVTENIQFKDLDQNHVVPNIGVITERGVWYPNLQF